MYFTNENQKKFIHFVGSATIEIVSFEKGLPSIKEYNTIFNYGIPLGTIFPITQAEYDKEKGKAEIVIETSRLIFS